MVISSWKTAPASKPESSTTPTPPNANANWQSHLLSKVVASRYALSALQHLHEDGDWLESAHRAIEEMPEDSRAKA